MPFEKDISVAQYECDLNNRMSVGAILRQTQQISTDHCDSVGATLEVLTEAGVAFLLAKLSVEINEDITVRDKLHMRTSPTAPQKASFYRYTTAKRQGETVFTVDARWILVSLDGHKILRYAPESISLPYDDTQNPSHDIKIKRVETQKTADIEVTYSRTDTNKHLNNTQYVDCICDILPQEEMTNRRIKKLVIYYHREAPIGTTIETGIGKIDENTYYISGERDGAKCFEAQVTFG